MYISVYTHTSYRHTKLYIGHMLSDEDEFGLLVAWARKTL